MRAWRSSTRLTSDAFWTRLRKRASLAARCSWTSASRRRVETHAIASPTARQIGPTWTIELIDTDVAVPVVRSGATYATAKNGMNVSDVRGGCAKPIHTNATTK